VVELFDDGSVVVRFFSIISSSEGGFTFPVWVGLDREMGGGEGEVEEKWLGFVALDEAYRFIGEFLAE